MTIIDWVLIAVIAISTLFSIWRGATREIISLITWVAAALLAYHFYGVLGGIFAQYISSHTAANTIAALLIVIVVVVLGTLAGMWIQKGISTVGLSVLDRVLGSVYGAIRGLLLIIIPIMFIQYTEVPKETWWKDSKLLPSFAEAAKSSSQWIAEHGGPDIKTKIDELLKDVAPADTTGAPKADKQVPAQTPTAPVVMTGVPSGAMNMIMGTGAATGASTGAAKH